MKTKMNPGYVLAAVMVFGCLANLYGWGPDIPIYTGGRVNCFDADYSIYGSLFVAFQPSGTGEVVIVESRDRGLSWTELYVHSAVENLNKVKIVAEDNLKNIMVYYRDPTGTGAGRLAMIQFNWEEARTRTASDPAAGVTFVSSGGIVDRSFDVCFSRGYFYAVWMQDKDATHKNIKLARAHHSLPRTWSDMQDFTIEWSSLEGIRVSVAGGPPANVYVSCCCHATGGSQCCLLKNTDEGVSAFEQVCVPVSASVYYDPRTAAANADAMGVWAVFNEDLGGHDINLCYAYSGGSDPVVMDCISRDPAMDEYVADLKVCRKYPEEAVGLVYIEDKEGAYRDACYIQTSLSDPLNWEGKQVFNDQDVTSWPEDVAPKLVFSPGSWTESAGAVFSYVGQNGLYFDASWREDPGALLIVTVDSFMTALEPLADWKSSTGIETFVIDWRTLTIGLDSADKIKQAIYDYYTQHDVRYVLLMGDSDLLPIRYTVDGYEEENPYKAEYLNKVEWGWSWCDGGPWHDDMRHFIPNFYATDLYYADLLDINGYYEPWDHNQNGYYCEMYRDHLNAENVDLKHDVAVGRVPAGSVPDVNHYVQKVIDYEGHAYHSSWFNKSCVIVNTDWTDWRNAGLQADDALHGAGFDNCYHEHGPGGNANDVISTATANGLGFLIYEGHGPGGIGDFADWNVCGYKLPVVFHAGCGPGKFCPNNLTHEGYLDSEGILYCGYPYDDSTGCTNLPRVCDGYPPVPDPLQPVDFDEYYPEFLLCDTVDRGAIAFYSANTGTQSWGAYLGQWFVEAYTKGHWILGDMWIDAEMKYYNVYAGTASPGFYHETFGGTVPTVLLRDWQPVACYHMIQKFNLLGDPSLRVGGIPAGGMKSGVYPEASQVAQAFHLDQNFPNPFNMSTEIRYRIPYETNVRIEVLNMLGETVEILIDENKKPGVYCVHYSSDHLSTGLYFYRLIFDNCCESKKMIVLK